MSYRFMIEPALSIVGVNTLLYYHKCYEFYRKDCQLIPYSEWLL